MTAHGTAHPVGRVHLAGRVHVWVVDFGDPRWDVDAAVARLSPAERERADRGAPPVRFRRVLLRSALRQVLGGLLDVPPAAVPISSVDGRPVVGGTRRDRRLQVSCSASGSIGLVGVAAGTAIGVDVEQVGDEDVADALAEGWLSPAESLLVERLAPGDRARALTRAWVHKEAVLKAQGVGLRADPGALVTPIADRGRVGRWFLAPVPVTGGAVASVAAARSLLHGRPPRVVSHRLSPGGDGHPGGGVRPDG